MGDLSLMVPDLVVPVVAHFDDFYRGVVSALDRYGFPDLWFVRPVVVFPSALTTWTATDPSGWMVTWSNVGGGPGNLDFAVFATQVPAQAPAGMSCATAISGAAHNSSEAAMKRNFIERISYYLFLRELCALTQDVPWTG